MINLSDILNQNLIQVNLYLNFQIIEVWHHPSQKKLRRELWALKSHGFKVSEDDTLITIQVIGETTRIAERISTHAENSGMEVIRKYSEDKWSDKKTVESFLFL